MNTSYSCTIHSGTATQLLKRTGSVYYSISNYHAQQSRNVGTITPEKPKPEWHKFTKRK